MLPPSTLTVRRASGDCAGPRCTEPSWIENRLPWQPQTMSPASTSATTHPWCVHLALNAPNCPDAGCVTTTTSLVNTIPPPTGTSSTFAISRPAGLVGGGFGDCVRTGGGFRAGGAPAAGGAGTEERPAAGGEESAGGHGVVSGSLL